ncbi:nitroreductase family protein [Christensenellaceae bacterium OttesenSCG-928-K19]|nr:nitroreductase family protein [Christensenellaceae bacterium OttesenSCG-928-K19]
MELMNAIAMRQSVRKYNATLVSSEDIDTILQAGCAAPVAGGGHERIHLTVIQNKELLAKIGAATAKAFGNEKFDPFYGAGTFLLVSVKPKESEPNIEIADGACVVENMLLAATGLGLASVYLWSFRWGLKEQPELVDEFGLPEGFVPVSGAVIGYADDTLKERQLALNVSHNIIK